MSNVLHYTTYGEEIQAGVGLRTPALGYSVTSADSLRQRYGLTERDYATGLDHTWFRKNEGRAGRWTSPDPYNGSISLGDPQSFNRYSKPTVGGYRRLRGWFWRWPGKPEVFRK